jgi:hypothetical protein
MITRAEAMARADAWINGDAAPQDRIDVSVFEFPFGYVVWGLDPAPADPTRPPQTVGGARGVIDRTSGELSVWPPLPAPVLAQQYTSMKAAEVHFREPALAALKAAGWRPGRDVSGDVARWMEHARDFPTDSGEPMLLFPAARAALDEFGGLRIEPPRAYAFSFHPIGHEPDHDLYLGLADILGTRVVPIGVRHDDGPSELTIDTDGRVFASHNSGTYVVADSLDAAIAKLVDGVGNTLPTVLADGSFRVV